MEMSNEDLVFALRHPPELLECPVCGEETKALKEYRFIDELFSLVFYHTWTMIDVVACPPCMRKHLLLRLGTTIPSANLIWPLVPLPHYTYFLLRTFEPGHSKSIRKEFEDAYQLALRRQKWAKEDALNQN